VTEARQKTEEYVTRRAAMAEQKIAQAERDAVNEVRSRAVDIAVEAAGRLLAGKVDQKVGAELFKTSLRDVRGKLN
jgi:F-type H+-transporting ATPase subunit b